MFSTSTAKGNAGLAEDATAPVVMRDPAAAVASRKRPRAAVLANPLQRQLYQLIVRQLHNDGYLAAASTVADATGTLVHDVEEDGDRLKQLVSNGFAAEAQIQRSIRQHQAEQVVERYISASKLYVPLAVSDNWLVGRKVFRMQERFMTSSLGGVIRDIMISPDGSLVSCAGTNGLAAVFHLESLENLTALDEVRTANQARGLDGSHRGKDGGGAGASSRNANEITELSLARRFHEHTQSVEVMRFHPTRPVLLTGGLDGDLYIREYSHPDSKVLLHVRDTFPIRSAVFHPTGEYVLFATDHNIPRLLNVRTGKLLTTPSVFHAGASGEAAQHSAGLSAVSFSHDGRTFTTAGLDGAWMLHDGVSGKVIHRMGNAHSAVPVTSVAYSRTGNVLLTAGMDSTARLWDLRLLQNSNTRSYRPSALNSSAAAEVMSFGEPGKCEHRCIRSVFSADESHVLCQDTTMFAIHNYCVYTGDTSYTLTTRPTCVQRGLAASPFANIVVTGGDDCRLRLWTPAWLPS